MKSKQLFQSTFFLIISVLMLTVGAFAWFYNMKQASAESLQFVSIDAIESEIKLHDQDEYDKNISHTIAVEDAKELSGLGYIKGSTLELYYPATDPFNGTVIVESGKWVMESKTIVANKNYLELQFDVRSSKPGKVHIVEGTSTNPLDLENKDRISQFGDFSQDYIVATTRMAFSEIKEDVEDLKLVFAPNKEIELIAPSKGRIATSGWTINDSSTNSQTYQYYDGEKLVTISASDLNKNKINDQFYFYDELDANGVEIGELSKGSDDYYYATFMLRVWIEGTDRDTEAALAGGKFNIKLNVKVFETTSED